MGSGVVDTEDQSVDMDGGLSIDTEEVGEVPYDFCVLEINFEFLNKFLKNI